MKAFIFFCHFFDGGLKGDCTGEHLYRGIPAGGHVALREVVGDSGRFTRSLEMLAEGS